MTIRDRTRPRNQRPRKTMTTAGSTPGVMSPMLGTNPPPLDGGPPLRPGLPGTRPPYPQPAPAPVPGTVPAPLYPEPAPPPAGGIGVPGYGDGQQQTPPIGAPNMGIQPVPATPMPKPTPGGPNVPSPTQPRPLYPEGPNMGIPGGPGSGQTPPGGQTPLPQPGYPYLGLDFMREVTPNELVANQLDTLLGSNSPYMQNARQRGLEYANSRGNLNGSMAAGASQRAALEAALPIAQSDADVYRQANAGNFESLSQLRQMRVAGDIENWLNSESYNRDFNGRLAMLPIQSSIDMLAYLAQRAYEDPAVYTPDVMSGFANFFNGNMFDILNRFYGQQPAGGD